MKQYEMVINMKKKIIEIYRDLHQIPELDFTLPETINYILAYLKDLNCEIEQPISSSVCAYFNFNKNKTIAYRSDMDALPISEENTHSYISKHPGIMHACGHDGHMAMLLTFASYISSLKECPYNVLLIFQPAEETTGGARFICESGILERKNVFAIFGIHLWPNETANSLLTKSGYLMAKSSEIHINIYGKSTHIATYEKGIDSLPCATSLLTTIYNKYPSNKDTLLKFGFLHAGTAGNCISDEAVLKGSLRSYDEKLHNNIISDLHKICKQVEKHSGCHILMKTTDGYPPLLNSDKLFETAKTIIPNLKETTQNFLSDDFSFYGQHAPSLYIYLGTGKKSMLHSSTFAIDEDTLKAGVNLYKKLLDIK